MPPRRREPAPAVRSRPVRLRHRLEYAAFRVVHDLLAAAPLALAMPVAAAVAAGLVRSVPRLRRIGMTNLAIAFPEKSDRERRAILLASFRNLGRMVAECAHVRRLTTANVRDVVSVETRAEWEAMVAHVGTRGVLVLTGHFGNWELFAVAHGLLGYPVHLVHQTIKNPLIDAFVERMRAYGGTQLLRKHGAARGVLRALGAGHLMVLPLDQNASGRTGIFIDFFGRAASTNAAFARIAARTGAPVFPAFLVREGASARHRIVILPPLSFASMADPDHAAATFTRRCTAVLESMIRRHPDHWLWTHKRWRTRPPGEAAIYDL